MTVGLQSGDLGSHILVNLNLGWQLLLATTGSTVVLLVALFLIMLYFTLLLLHVALCQLVKYRAYNYQKTHTVPLYLLVVTCRTRTHFQVAPLCTSQQKHIYDFIHKIKIANIFFYIYLYSVNIL